MHQVTRHVHYRLFYFEMQMFSEVFKLTTWWLIKSTAVNCAMMTCVDLSHHQRAAWLRVLNKSGFNPVDLYEVPKKLPVLVGFFTYIEVTSHTAKHKRKTNGNRPFSSIQQNSFPAAQPACCQAKVWEAPAASSQQTICVAALLPCYKVLWLACKKIIVNRCRTKHGNGFWIHESSPSDIKTILYFGGWLRMSIW